MRYRQCPGKTAAPDNRRDLRRALRKVSCNFCEELNLWGRRAWLGIFGLIRTFVQKLVASSRNREAGLLFYTGFFGSLDLISRRESFRTPNLPRFHKGNSGGELAVAAWQLTEADSGQVG